ncbi:MAG: response regulator [Phaeodactylibacter sp.]|uniref:LytR/AlgR family response regulator transcription factor n=1 Tax=Phaeodactylibacter sp. TaxID=1940289 RepID=UPI0032F08D25
MNSFRILIVEDEVLIADTIERHLAKKDYVVTGKAISCEEAIESYQQTQPDLVLLDIRLNGSKTGIDVARWLREQGSPPPFIYLTSQIDRQSLDAAKSTYPAGYLSKPVQPQSLYSTIEIALHNHQAQEKQKTTIRLYNGKQYFQAPVDNILYLRADHIYVKITLQDEEEVVQRATLKEMIDQLPEGQFVQTHRSYAVNIQQVTRWDQDYLYIHDFTVPVSRGRRQEVLALLESRGQKT